MPDSIQPAAPPAAPAAPADRIKNCIKTLAALTVQANTKAKEDLNFIVSELLDLMVIAAIPVSPTAPGRTQSPPEPKAEEPPQVTKP